MFLEFASPFWEEQLGADTQQFGVVLAEDADSRGFCSNFWNFKPFTGAYILCGLLTGSSAIAMENMDDSVLVSRAQSVLKTVLHNVPEPVRTSVTRWGEDPFAHGSYSFVGIGGRGDHYDLMARPIGRTLLFCGEGTSKEHLDTVGGAILTGRREVHPLVCAVLQCLISIACFVCKTCNLWSQLVMSKCVRVCRQPGFSHFSQLTSRQTQSELQLLHSMKAFWIHLQLCRTRMGGYLRIRARCPRSLPKAELQRRESLLAVKSERCASCSVPSCCFH